MGKKNNYKPQKKYSALKGDGLLIRGKFSIDTAKMYLIALIAVFHILPLPFLAFGDTGRQLLNTVCMLVLNPMCIFIIMMFYGIRVGFNFKMPIIATLIGTAAIAMYYTDVNQNAYVYHLCISTLISFCVYGIFSYASALIGGFIKHFLI